MRKNDTIRLTVTDVNNLGCGVGHLQNAGARNGQTVFLPGGVTGDEWEAQVIKLTRDYLVARPVRLLEPSPHRIPDDCPARGCGGCAYRCMSYAYELELKRGYVRSAFRKAGLEADVEAVRSTGRTAGYRNKAQYPVGLGRDGTLCAGFYAGYSHRLVPAGDCLLQPPLFGEVVREVCELAGRLHIEPYREETGRGLLRHIYLRQGEKSGELMLCLVLSADCMPGEATLVRELTARFPQLSCLMLNINPARTNVVLGRRWRLLYGRDWIEDTLCGLRLRIPPQAFYQVNHGACELLYDLVGERAGLTGNELLLDLYCGIGSIGLSLAGQAGEVLGLEIVEEAVRCAAENAARNGISNAAFFCGDASDPRDLLRRARELRGDLSGAVAVLDPPRKGTTPELIAAVAEAGIRRVVYVSCNPDTLARDCVRFASHGYIHGPVTPVDLFPRTGHVECVTLLEVSPEKKTLENPVSP